MDEEKIAIKAKLNKGLNDFARLMGDLGYSKISYNKKNLVVEKIKGHDLRGNPFLEYRMVFSPDSIVFEYSIPANKNRRVRLLELVPTLLSVLQVAEEYYTFVPSEVYGHINSVVKDLLKVVDKEAAESSAALSDLESRYVDLNRRYEELVRSSESNARILLECERRRDELAKRVEHLTNVSDDSLKETLYNWIKIHGGTINVPEFSKSNGISISRVEEGLNFLISDGFIKRRVD